jgi:hypothetical protein
MTTSKSELSHSHKHLLHTTFSNKELKNGDQGKKDVTSCLGPERWTNMSYLQELRFLPQSQQRMHSCHLLVPLVWQPLLTEQKSFPSSLVS